MSDRYSFPFRCIRNQSEAEGMSQAISDELFSLSHQAAGKVRPGATVKEQLMAAWENLGRPPMWRLKSAWWRDGSADWSAKAVKDFQERFLAWREAEARRAASNFETERARQMAADRATLEAERDKCVAALARLESRLASISLYPVDPV